LDVTSADGVLIARGALGNPWIFKQIDELLTQGAVVTRPTIAQHVALMRTHAKRHYDQYGARGIVTFRKHVSWYMKGLHGAKELRSALVRVSSFEELDTLLAPYIASLDALPAYRHPTLQPTVYALT
ncbi:tRNA-dihydrouridine synthase, partial [Candidatus Uhrbacteria bacterium]|nr:tRNA-dihydrouridine synthase [Candidatus Uhrbacteria bacterium]